jgi:hypothetical protein
MSEFQLDDYTDDWCHEFLRFSRQEIRFILPFIRLDLCAYRFRYNPSPETAFCLLLYKLSWPHRLKDTLNLFGRSRAWQSSVFNDTMLHLVSRYRDMLYWDHERLNLETLRRYALAIERYSTYPNIWGFIDGTIRPMCRPGIIEQRFWYTGYKKLFGFKFQGISTPDGLITSLAGPTTAKDGDWALWHESDIETVLRNLFVGVEDGTESVLYGDPAYVGSYGVIGAYVRQPGRPLTDAQSAFNRELSSIRITI